MKRAALWLVLTLAAGCGQKGPLYLPDRNAEVITAPASAPAPEQPAPPAPPPQPKPADKDQGAAAPK